MSIDEVLAVANMRPLTEQEKGRIAALLQRRKLLITQTETEFGLSRAEVEDLIESWAEDEDAYPEGKPATTPLQAQVKECHELSEEICIIESSAFVPTFDAETGMIFIGPYRVTPKELISALREAGFEIEKLDE